MQRCQLNKASTKALNLTTVEFSYSTDNESFSKKQYLVIHNYTQLKEHSLTSCFHMHPWSVVCVFTGYVLTMGDKSVETLGSKIQFSSV